MLSRLSAKWFLTAAVLLACCNFQLRAQQPNAWQINDSTGFSGVAQYVTNLTAAQVAAANANGWHMSLLSRIEADTANPASQSIAFGDGSRRFYIYFDLDGSGKLTAQLLSSSNVTYTMTLPAPDVMKYHLHEMIYDPATSLATYRFDGQVIAAWPGNVSTLQSNQVMWGANSSAGMGTMDYHRVEFDINGQGPIAVYDAGFQGAPITAPSPTNQGWAHVVSGLVPTEAARSPDNEFIHPIALTSNAVSLRPGEATLTASINPNGLPAVFSFDHGLTTAYGNSTAQFSAGNGTDFALASTLLTGLPRGVPYHYRVVASNTAGSVYGSDMTFTVPQGATISTSPAGGGQPLDIRQPSLVLNYIVCTNGNYPDSSTMQTPFLGEVRLFAGNFAPAGWSFCWGQLIPTNGNYALLSIIQGSYGSQGGTNFALPDLRGRTVVDAGQGQGLEQWYLGQRQGVELLSLVPSQLPAHTHSLPPLNGVASGSTGNSLPRQNQKPSLGLSCLFTFQGNYPYSGQSVAEPFIGQIPFFAGGFAGDKYTFATGQTLATSQNTAVYNVVGTNYGGSQSTFALPDLRGRSPIGSGQAPGMSSRVVAQQVGSPYVTMSLDQMPAHHHVVPWFSPYSFTTGTTGTNQPQSQTFIHPALVLQYLICTNGEVPSAVTRATNRMIGEIQLFAGTNVPTGWLPCDGQLLQVSRPTAALSGVLSNFYGGDGFTTFALPDLRGRFAVGSTNGQPGAVYGAEQGVLTLDQVPSHTHTAPGLDFDSWITSLGVSGPDAAFDADADGDGAKNGLEWATGTNPTNAQSFAGLMISSATNAVDVQFIRETNATDVNFVLQRTFNLTNSAWPGLVSNIAGVWSGVSTVQETGSNNLVNVHVFDSVSNNPSATYRLNVTLP